MIEINQISPKEFQVVDQAGFVRGIILESVGFWVIQMGDKTPTACESYERAVTLAHDHCNPDI